MSGNSDSSVTTSQPIAKQSGRAHIAQLPEHASCREIERQVTYILEDIKEKKKWGPLDYLQQLLKVKFLMYDKLHQILTNTSDENGQTCMFHTNRYMPLIRLYFNHVEDLYELLSIRDANGQTALHVNTIYITYLLAETYIPKHRDAFIKLTSITDNNNQTALQFSSLDCYNEYYLSMLIRRVENNEYITINLTYSTILAIYNTNNRPGAEKEAEIISSTFGKVYDSDNFEILKNKTREQIIDLTKQVANGLRMRGASPTLIVILMSRGGIGTIDDCNGKPIRLSDIEKAMCSERMIGKPKLLITHCWRNWKQTAVAYQPIHDDFCAIMSCVAGLKGREVFLRKFAEQMINFSSSSRDSILEILSNITTEMEREGHKQTPIVKSTLTAEFYPTDMWCDYIH